MEQDGGMCAHFTYHNLMAKERKWEGKKKRCQEAHMLARLSGGGEQSSPQKYRHYGEGEVKFTS